MSRRADILMVTYKSAGYLHLSLPRLLETCGENDRVWLWHNGDDEDTLDALGAYRSDPRVDRFYHSRENVRLGPPTAWLWSESTARFVSKVDDDCRVTPGWLDVFADAHDCNPEFGVVGSWRPLDEDFRPELAERKIQTYAGGHRLMRNLWVQGSGYLLRRSWLERVGLPGEGETFTNYCIRIARAGAVNGFYYPFVAEDHMDDPRSPHTLIRTDDDLRERLPLSAQVHGVRTVDDWIAQLKQSAIRLQSAPVDHRALNWRRKVRGARRRVQSLVGRPSRW